MPMCICFSTGGSVSKQSRLLFDLHTYEHKIEELYTITVHPYFDCIFSEYLYWRKLYVYLFHWYIISRVTYSFMKMVPSVYTRLMKAGSSSQCQCDELMLFKCELMLLKCQINANTYKNGFLLSTKCLERVQTYSYIISILLFLIMFVSFTTILC